jgi:hypothetical protein
MRSMAILAGAITVAGIYLAIAATVGIGTTVTALGVLAIALVAAVAMVAAPAAERAVSRA